MSPLDYDQVGHISRLAILAMCARAVAASEFEDAPEVSEVVIRVGRGDARSAVLSVDVEFHARGGLPVGGMSL